MKETNNRKLNFRGEKIINMGRLLKKVTVNSVGISKPLLSTSSPLNF
jgi:hypothetical protein